VLPGRETVPAERVDSGARDADLWKPCSTNAGMVSIFRASLDQQVNSIDFKLAELARTVIRLKDQLRGLNRNRSAGAPSPARRGDGIRAGRLRSSGVETLLRRLKQFLAALAENSATLRSSGACSKRSPARQNLRTKQSRVITELQNSLRAHRMVSSSATSAVDSSGPAKGGGREPIPAKRANCGQGAWRNSNDRCSSAWSQPLEHMLRNDVVTGIEPADRRGRSAQAGEAESR